LVITRVAGTVTVDIYEDDAFFYTLSLTGLGTTTYRYLLPALTGNDGEATNTDVDLDDYILETETDLLGGNVTNNTFRDIIHSWTPTFIDNIRIRIVAQDTAHSWSISQIYIYKATNITLEFIKRLMLGILSDGLNPTRMVGLPSKVLVLRGLICFGMMEKPIYIEMKEVTVPISLMSFSLE